MGAAGNEEEEEEEGRQVKVKGCYINRAVTVRAVGRGSRNSYKKELGRVARLGAEPSDPRRPSFELTPRKLEGEGNPGPPSFLLAPAPLPPPRARARALQCNLIYGPGAHT